MAGKGYRTAENENISRVNSRKSARKAEKIHSRHAADDRNDKGNIEFFAEEKRDDGDHYDICRGKETRTPRNGDSVGIRRNSELLQIHRNAQKNAADNSRFENFFRFRLFGNDFLFFRTVLYKYDDK